MMHSLGADVTGVDLSEESIAESRKGATDNLQFQVGDMRYLEDLPNFDTICSLFTSFGYFAQDEDNLQMLRSVKAHLKNEGHFVNRLSREVNQKSSHQVHHLSSEPWKMKITSLS